MAPQGTANTCKAKDPKAPSLPAAILPRAIIIEQATFLFSIGLYLQETERK